MPRDLNDSVEYMPLAVRGTVRLKTLIYGAVFSCFMSLSVSADDLDIFTEGASREKQNVLFILDYSQSMNESVPGENKTKRQAQIEAVSQVINDLGEHINIGVSFFGTTSSGIRWPITDTEARANTVDGAIPGSFEVDELVQQMLPAVSPQNGTNAVAALTEAALYFQGGNVLNGGHPADDPAKFEPPTWDATSNSYQGGYAFAPNPAAYYPGNAFKPAYRETRTRQVEVETPSSSGDASQSCTATGTDGSVDTDSGGAGSTINCNAPGVTVTGTVSGGTTTGTTTVTETYEVDIPAEWTGANYIAPPQQECVSNYIIMVSDGDPNLVPEYSAIKPNVDESVADFARRCASQPGQPEGVCGPEIAKYLYERKFGSYENSNIKTFTVGFGELGSSSNYLKNLAEAGGGEYHEAKRAKSLSRAIADIIDEVIIGNFSFAEPSVGVNTKTYENDNRAFIPMFTPSFTRSWHGNLKGYFLEDGMLGDVYGIDAVEKNSSGEFLIKEGSSSFWSDKPDGPNISKGGVQGRLNARINERTLYTYTGNSVPTTGVSLAGSGIRTTLSSANGSITTDMLGIPGNSDYADELLDWIADAPMGAPLHSNTVSIRYENRTVVYVMTNRGFFHAIDATFPTEPTGDRSGGEEIYAFMPRELLKNIPDIYTGIASGDHIYGLDGQMVPIHEDENGDGIVNGSDTITMVFGMRRGGSNYYALDVTQPANPVYRWKIEGGSGDFFELKQTWSKPALVTVKSRGNDERVLVFGGGYDDEILDAGSRVTSSGGNAVYIVDLNGKLIWKAKHPEMRNSIPSDVRVIDTNNDGYTDRMYVGDVSGKVWRIDLDDIYVPSKYETTLLADVGGRTYEPFLYPPSVSFVDGASKRWMAVVLGSGNRADPLNKNSGGAIYMIRDVNYATGKPATYRQTIRLGALHDATSNSVYSTNPAVASEAREDLLYSPGWTVRLGAGEKVLSETALIQGRVLATTFAPNETETTDRCGAITTEGRFYALNLGDGSPSRPLDGSDGGKENWTVDDRSTLISTRGIPPKPIVTVNLDDNKLQVIVGKENVVDLPMKVQFVSWYSRY